MEPIRLSVQLSFDEFAEAVRAVQQTNAARMSAQQRRPSWRVAAPVTLVVAALILLVLYADPSPHTRPPLYALTALLLPPLALLATILVHNRIVGVRAKTTAPAASNPRIAGLLLAVAALAVVAAVWLFAVRARPHAPAPAPPPRDWYGTFAPHAVWIGLLAAVLVALARVQARQLKTLWDSQPRLRRPLTVEIADGGIAFDDVLSQRRYQWLGFVRLITTPNLLILCPSDITFEILPRSAFASPAQAEQARQMLQTQIVDPDNLSYAFPVQTAAAPQDGP